MGGGLPVQSLGKFPKHHDKLVILVSIQALLCSGCVALGKFLNLSVPPFPHLLDRICNRNYFDGFWEIIVGSTSNVLKQCLTRSECSIRALCYCL